jgi:cation:H+ antiporter
VSDFVSFLDVNVLPFALLLVGGLALAWGGDKLVEYAAHLARSFSVPQHVVGAVVLGFGTSAPEAVVCVTAAVTDNPGLAVGTVVGSNIANVGLILGVAALLSPFVVQRKLLVVDLPLGLIVGIGLAVWLVTTESVITRGAGLVLLVLFAAYLVLSVWQARLHQLKTTDVDAPERRLARDLLWIAFSLATVIVGAKVFVSGAEAAATILGVPKEVIGLTIMAFGTSLPELVTTVAAARHGHAELAVGNVAGSNIFNLLFVLGGGALVGDIDVSESFSRDMWVMVGFAVLAFPVLQRHARVGRRQGVLLVTLYLAYVGWLYFAG